MSNPHLPPEIRDHIVDLLHDEPETLKECCLVSKSWVPRTRKYLFASVELNSEEDRRSWIKKFPDPSNSPAFHTHSLKISSTQVIRAAGGWIQAFSRIASLHLRGSVDQYFYDSEAPLAPFYKLSPTLKSLCVYSTTLPYPELFTLVRSSPLLEDLTLAGHDMLLWNGDDPHGSQGVVPSASPVLTGSLDLMIEGGMEYTARQLLNLPNGLHFRRLRFSWDQEEDSQWIMKLVVGCSNSLEYLDFRRSGNPSPASLDLSKATKLRDATFWSGSPRADWITMALQTITPKHREFQQISIYVPYYLTCFDVGDSVRRIVGETDYRQWLDLDCLLVHLWESHSIRPRVVCATLGDREQSTKYCVGRLLPKITRRGIIHLV